MNSPSIILRFKNNTVLQSFMEHAAHPIMTDLVHWIFSTGLVAFLTVTSAFRNGDRGVHGTNPYRGMDIRSWDQDDPQGLVDHINNHWQYDPKRPKYMCAKLHDAGNGIHIHLQVHPNTILVKGGW